MSQSNLEYEARLNELHLAIFDDAMQILSRESSKPADLAEVMAWVLRPSRLYSKGRLVYDGMKNPFSFQLCCKAAGCDPDLYREKLVESGILPQEIITLSQYLAEYKVIKVRDEKSERMLNKLLGETANDNLKSLAVEFISNINMYIQCSLFEEIELELPAEMPPSLKLPRLPRVKHDPIESLDLFVVS